VHPARLPPRRQAKAGNGNAGPRRHAQRRPGYNGCRADGSASWRAVCPATTVVGRAPGLVPGALRMSPRPACRARLACGGWWKSSRVCTPGHTSTRHRRPAVTAVRPPSGMNFPGAPRRPAAPTTITRSEVGRRSVTSDWTSSGPLDYSEHSTRGGREPGPAWCSAVWCGPFPAARFHCLAASLLAERTAPLPAKRCRRTRPTPCRGSGAR